MLVSRLLMCILFFQAMLFGVTSTAMATAPPVTVSVCGEAKDEMKAAEDARYKAVSKVLAKILPPQKEPNSPFQRILKDYAAYAGKPEVKKKLKDGDTIQLISKVTVNQQKLLDAIEQINGDAPDHNVIEGKNICFLIRVNGVKDNGKTSKYEAQVSKVCNDRFQRLGFHTDIEDDLMVTLGKTRHLHYDGFFQELAQRIKIDYPEIMMTVIGEIKITPGDEDATGFIQNGDVRLKVLDMLQNRVVVELNERYRTKHGTKEGAELSIVEKTALNSAETLAAKVMKLK